MVEPDDVSGVGAPRDGLVLVRVGDQDVWMTPRSDPASAPYLRSRKEPFTIDWFRRCCRRQGAIWDVGANVGEFTLFAAKVSGSPGRVTAFEPNRYARQALVSHLRQNGMGNDVIVRATALGSITTDGLLSVGSKDPYYGKSFVVTDKRGRKMSAEVLDVQVTTIDDLVDQGVEPPAFLKIDVEGHELAVVEGGVRTLPTIESCLIEVASGNSEAMRRLLREAGFGQITQLARRANAKTGAFQSEYISADR